MENGEKQQTIRRKRSRPFKVGDKLQLYTGLRTKEARKLINPDPVCSELWDITIGDGDVKLIQLRRLLPGGRATEKILFGDIADEFAIADGFRDAVAMFRFFEKVYGLPFEGQVIKWQINSRHLHQPS